MNQKRIVTVNRANILTQVWWSIANQFVVLGLFSLLVSHFISDDDYRFHTIYCLIALLIFISKYKALRYMSLRILLEDHRIIFSLCYILYFIVGSSFLTLGKSEDIQTQLNNYFPIELNASYFLMVDALNSFGYAFALLASIVTKPKILPRLIAGTLPILDRLKILKVSIFFIIIGAIFRFDLLNNEFSSDPKLVDGYLNQLSSLLNLGVFLGMLYQGKSQKIIWIIMVIISLINSFFGLIQFSKFAFISPIVLASLGLAIRKDSLKTLLFCIGSIFLLMSLLAGALMYSRVEYQTINPHSIQDRLSLVMAGIRAAEESDPRAQVSTWARLNYMPAQVAGIQFFNSDNGGKDLSKILWMFIPRFILPEKPIMSLSGGELSYKISGREENSSEGLGIFIDGYYNAGWLGLLCYSCLAGFMIAQTSKISQIIVAKKRYILYPAIFLGVYISFRIDGFFMTDVLGIFIYLAICIFIAGFYSYSAAKFFQSK